MIKHVFVICSFLLIPAGLLFGQQDSVRSSEEGKMLTDYGTNDPTFRDDSTDAAMGMSGLDATPGTATTSGAGGLGTNQYPGYNTSSDVYNIERRDSIERAKKNKSLRKEKNQKERREQ